MVSGSSQSTNICPPHSPTRITKNSILKLAGAFHSPNTSRIRFCAFSYSAGEPCGRSNQLITYFISSPLFANGLTDYSRLSLLLGGDGRGGPAERKITTLTRVAHPNGAPFGGWATLTRK